MIETADGVGIVIAADDGCVEVPAVLLTKTACVYVATESLVYSKTGVKIAPAYCYSEYVIVRGIHVRPAQPRMA